MGTVPGPRCVSHPGLPSHRREGDSPSSQNKGLGLLKQAQSFPLSSFTHSWALPSQLLTSGLAALALPLCFYASSQLSSWACQFSPFRDFYLLSWPQKLLLHSFSPPSSAAAFLSFLMAQTGFLAMGFFSFAAACLVAFSIASLGFSGGNCHHQACPRRSVQQRGSAPGSANPVSVWQEPVAGLTCWTRGLAPPIDPLPRLPGSPSAPWGPRRDGHKLLANPLKPVCSLAEDTE